MLPVIIATQFSLLQAKEDGMCASGQSLECGCVCSLLSYIIPSTAKCLQRMATQIV